MASTQYIGARYVPIFYTNPDDNTNNWHSGVAYEALTIVTDLNQSYTSKIPVPANIGRPSENPAYWVLTGAYNAQVETLRQTFTETVSEMEESFDTFKTDVENDIAALIDSNITEFSKFNNKIMVVVGDSLAKGRYVNPDQAYPAIAAAAMGMTCKNFAQNSGGYTRSGNMNVSNQLLNASTDTSFNNDDVAIVLISAGVNDVNDNPSSSVMYTAVSDAITNAKTYFPNARIIVTNYTCGNMTVVCRNNVQTSIFVHANIARAAILAGVQCINNASCWGIGHTDWFTSTGPSPYGDEVNADSWHPNVTGNMYYGYYLLQNIIKCEYRPNFGFTPVGNANVVGDVINNENMSGTKCFNGQCSLSGRWNIVPGEQPLAVFAVSLPTYMCRNTYYPIWINGYVYDTAAPKIKIPIEIQHRSSIPQGDTQPTCTMSLVPPDGGWKSTHVLVIPEYNFEIGS